jgi:hypothetical protein
MGRMAHEKSELINGFYTVGGSQMFRVNCGSYLVRLCIIKLNIFSVPYSSVLCN